ncbi:Hypothetical protein A7982_00035 [Minicystis rosea]|nr:Hypothetical protein A7982_00035 [Minicystis rosea]
MQKVLPCVGDPPGARLDYHYWCDSYRPDGTLLARAYHGHIAGGGERSWSQILDEHGKVTDEGRNCDSGHN